MKYGIIIGIVVVLLLAIGGAIVSIFRNKKIGTIEQTQDDYFIRNGITKSADYKWSSSLGTSHYRVVVDEAAEKIYISRGIDTQFICIPYSEIMGFETITDDKITGSIKRAIVGGIIAGGVGAVVGAMTANEKKINNYKAILYRDNVQHPTYEFNFINIETNKTDVDYILAEKFTYQISAIVKGIVGKTQSREDTDIKQDGNEQSAVLDSLSKLKIAYENKLISDDEYEAKKKELLDRI